MLSAGEASGDLHGASIACALRAQCPGVRLFGMGGQAMREAGVEVLFDLGDYGVMGFAEVVKNLPRLFALRDKLAQKAAEERPDVFVTIDYPDFNLRLAKKIKALGIPVFSYIPPSAWAWRKGRAKEVAALADAVAAIFPFELPVYEAAGANIRFVGHPLADLARPSMEPEAARAYFGADPARPVVLLLPGSRAQEIEKLLPVMLEGALRMREKRADLQFYLPVASTISRETLQGVLARYDIEVRLTEAHTYDLMGIADAAVAASGTVTLEAALLGLPCVVVYRMAALTYWIGKLLVRIPHFSLPNIIAGRAVLPELLQASVTPQRIAEEALRLLPETPEGKAVRAALGEVRQRLGEGGAADRTAALILETAAKRPRIGRPE